MHFGASAVGGRCPYTAAALRAAAHRPAGVVARSSHTAEYARRSRLASGPVDQQQSGSLILSQTLRLPADLFESDVVSSAFAKL